jgi:hypothetical protein
LSEQAKLVLLQEKIKDAKNHERGGTISYIFGMVAVVIGFVMNAFPFSSPPWFGTVVIVVGAIIVIIGLWEHFHYWKRRNILMVELESMTWENLKCPKCGKVVPEGNHTFCPFCGSPLAPPPP